MPMRVGIVGAGAIGCYLAASLARAGHEVELVGRQEQADAINASGLLVTMPDGKQERFALHTTTELDGPVDLILLAVKTQDVSDACKAIASRDTSTPVVALQNGVRADRLAGDELGHERVLGGVVMCGVTYTKPGEISVQFAGWLILGEAFGPPQKRTHEIARTLRSALPTYHTHNLERTRWSKLIYNLINGVSAATGLTQPEIIRSPAGLDIVVHIFKEGYLVARASGITLDHGVYGLEPQALRQDPNASLVGLLQASFTALVSAGPEFVARRVLALAGRSRLGALSVRSSTWQSIVRQRPTEIEYLNGEIVQRGKLLGISTPYNARVVEAVHQVERSHSFLPVEELLPESARTRPLSR